MTWLEKIKSKITIELVKNNKQIEKFNEPESYVHAIGFAAPREEYYDEEEEDA